MSSLTMQLKNASPGCNSITAHVREAHPVGMARAVAYSNKVAVRSELSTQTQLDATVTLGLAFTTQEPPY